MRQIHSPFAFIVLVAAIGQAYAQSNTTPVLSKVGEEVKAEDAQLPAVTITTGTLKLRKVLSVADNLGAVNNLNELEMIDGFIYANRWQYDYILKIDPSTGHVVGRLNFQDFLARNSKKDLTYLKKEGSSAVESGAVLNGIAYDPKEKKLYITGKLWPEVFEIKLN